MVTSCFITLLADSLSHTGTFMWCEDGIMVGQEYDGQGGREGGIVFFVSSHGVVFYLYFLHARVLCCFCHIFIRVYPILHLLVSFQPVMSASLMESCLNGHRLRTFYGSSWSFVTAVNQDRVVFNLMSQACQATLLSTTFFYRSRLLQPIGAVWNYFGGR